MNEFHLPWLGLSILIPLWGAVAVGRLKDSDLARRWTLGFTGLTLCCTIGAWIDFITMHATQADDRWHLLSRLFGQELFALDELSVPLLSLTALLYFLTAVATLRTKIRRFSFAWTLVSEAILLATFSCQKPWGIVALLAMSILPPYLELRARRKPRRIFCIYMTLFVVMLIAGQFLLGEGVADGPGRMWGTALMVAAILLRSGVFPLHGWATDFFEHATFGTSLLFTLPVVGAYATIRLVLPSASVATLECIGMLSLITAVYTAGMALVQNDVRRFFCYLALGHSALVFVGVASISPISLTGALSVWLSATLSLGGLGLTLRALESRRGRLSMDEYQGLYEHTPNLATFFVLTGLASVGFPGTFGFVGTELLVDGVVGAFPHVGIAIVVAAAFSGIAVLRAFFLLFTGTHYVSSVSLKVRVSERYSVLGVAALILIGGLFPQSNIESRFHVSEALLKGRQTHGQNVAFPPVASLLGVEIGQDRTGVR